MEQLKSEKCPRISLQDLLQIMDIRNGKLYMYTYKIDLLVMNSMHDLNTRKSICTNSKLNAIFTYVPNFW